MFSSPTHKNISAHLSRLIVIVTLLLIGLGVSANTHSSYKGKRKFARHPHKKTMTFASGYHGGCGCSH